MSPNPSLPTPRVSVLKPGALEPRHWAKWLEFLDADPLLASPLFSPAYPLAVAEVVANIFVGVVEVEGEPVAFLPFVRNSSNIGERLPLCDYQALIAKPGFSVDAVQLIKQCGLRSWDFDHLLAEQTGFRAFHRSTASSPFIDLTAGFESYAAERRSAGTEQIKKSGNLLRRLEREIGPVRFEMHVPDENVLRQLLQWKYSKYEKSRHSSEAITGVLNRLMSVQRPECSGTLSVLYAGNNIVASHFGLRSRDTWHYWFPAYDSRFEKYSPGMILLLKMAAHAPDLGIKRIDLGRGEQDYKRRLMNGAISLAEGAVEVSPFLCGARSMNRALKSWLGNHPRISSPVRSVFALLRKSTAIQCVL
jgi:CelD/BcsL family acetyltransferase involved in cellulose biosynthesis